jgi:hypothetical protein
MVLQSLNHCGYWMIKPLTDLLTVALSSTRPELPIQTKVIDHSRLQAKNKPDRATAFAVGHTFVLTLGAYYMSRSVLVLVLP